MRVDHREAAREEARKSARAIRFEDRTKNRGVVINKTTLSMDSSRVSDRGKFARGRRDLMKVLGRGVQLFACMSTPTGSNRDV